MIEEWALHNRAKYFSGDVFVLITNHEIANPTDNGPDVLSKQTTQLYFQKLPFRGQTKLELHPNLLEIHKKNDVPPSIHEADAIAYISNHKISELNLENSMNSIFHM